MFYFHKTKNKKGVSIYLALIVMVIFLGMGFGLANILLSLKKTIRGMSDSVNTLAAADTGVEHMLLLEKQCWGGSLPNCSGSTDDNCKSGCRGRVSGYQDSVPISLDNGATYQAQIIRACGLNTVFSTSTYRNAIMRIKFTVGRFKPGTTTNSASGKHCYDYCLQVIDDCPAGSVGTNDTADNGYYYPADSALPCDAPIDPAGSGTGTVMNPGTLSCPTVPPPSPHQTAWTNCYCTSTISY